ncbi:hypothetical protein BGX28_009749 [Mortierella sp. GBA30]|nr:hypothetical protein BGX28_009749 [Mortierella sp. GBA30]
MAINIKIKYSIKEAQDFIVIVDPLTIVPNGKLWTDVFPVAWKVAEFGSTGRNPDFDETFSVERTCGVNTISDGNLVKIGCNQPVGQNHKNNKFQVVKDGDTYSVVLNANDPDSDVSAEIYNTVNAELKVFYGDKNADPMITSDVLYKRDIAFKEVTEFVIAAVNDYQDHQLLKSEMRGPWMKFTSQDAETFGNQMFVEFGADSTYTPYDGCQTPFQQFDADVPIFKKLASASEE